MSTLRVYCLISAFISILVLTLAAQEALGQDPAGEVLDTGFRVLANGEVFEYVKQRVDGREEILYTGQGLSLTADELDLYEATHAPAVIDEDLAALSRQAVAQSPLELTVWLRPRPGARIARDVHRERREAIEEQAEAIRDVYRSVLPAASLTPEEERAFVAQAAADGGLLTEAQRADVRSRSEQLERDVQAVRAEIRRRREAAVTADQRRIAERITELGGEVLNQTVTQNALSIRLPADRLTILAEDPLVARIVRLPSVESALTQHAECSELSRFRWPDDVTGGLNDAGILGSGLQRDHPALADVTVMSQVGRSDPDGQGTAATGIIASRDEEHRGLAYGLDKLLVGSYSSDQVLAHADWMVSVNWEDPEAIYLGGDYGRASAVDYSVFDQFWDGLVDDNSVLVATGAGDSGPDPVTLTHPSTAYNLIAVTPMDERGTAERGDDRAASSASRGPSPGGRKKPDMAAPGTDVCTLNNDWAAPGPPFTEFSGSAAAAGFVTGTAVLLADLRNSDNPTASKAVLLNTADAWSDGGTPGLTEDDGPIAGSAWNSTYGWGYLDMGEAYYNGLDVFVETLLGPGEFKLYTGSMYPGEKATLVWNRHVGYNGSSFPIAFERLTDLDLVLYDEATGQVMSHSTSGIDNVEQVALGGPLAASGSTPRDVVLKVAVYGSIDPDIERESFALATEERFAAASLPLPPHFRSTHLGPVSPNQEFQLPAGLLNPSPLSTHGNSLEISLPPGFVLTSGHNPWPVGSIASGDSREVVWTVRAPCATGRHHAVRRCSHHSYGERDSRSESLAIDVATTLLPGDRPGSSTLVPQTFQFNLSATDWSAVALDPGGSPLDLRADDGMCMSSPYASSELPGTARDFIVTNGHRTPGGTHYALVDSSAIRSGRVAPYTVEHQVAYDQPADAAAAPREFAPEEVVEVFEAVLEDGEPYKATVDIRSGTTDVALFVYGPDRLSGTRADADLAVDDGGAGVGESLDFTASVSGVHAFVVVNENARASVFEFSLKNNASVFEDGFETGDAGLWSQARP